MDLLKNSYRCTGCEACKNICPNNALRMQENCIGEIYPVINEKLCINCKKCYMTCPAVMPPKFQNSIKGFAAYRRDENAIKLSASGGVASVFGENMIRQGGLVWGVEIDKYCQIVFSCANCKEDLEKFKGSKYIQPKMRNIYNEIGIQLKNNKQILLIGLPCQIAGCLNYLAVQKISTKRLIIIDLICHGVVPYTYLQQEIVYLKKKYGWSRVTNVRFRCNQEGYDYNLSLYDGEKVLGKWSAMQSPYFYAFLRGISLCEECYKCNYAKRARVGDITIGDFAGYDKNNFAIPPSDKIKNISVVLVNTEKGMTFLQQCQSELELCLSPLEEIWEMSESIKKKTERNAKRDEFLDIMERGDMFPHAIRKCVKREILYNKCLRYINYIYSKIGITRLKEK